MTIIIKGKKNTPYLCTNESDEDVSYIFGVVVLVVEMFLALIIIIIIMIIIIIVTKSYNLPKFK